ncbi:MAG: TetR/AcrR family transcriptional regulator [Bacteroidota bacterium]
MLTKREQILTVSTRLFRDKGYSASSMQDIASELEIKPASLYNHISAKQEILRELLSKGANLFIEGLSSIESSSLTSFQKLEKVINLHLRLSVEYSDLMAIMAVEWRHLDDDAKTSYIRNRDKYEEGVRGMLKSAIEEKSIIPIDPEIALFTILTTLQRLYAWYDRHQEVNIFDMEKHLITCLLGGIKS